jgi:protein dithiol oxidoreductase (disulfide-forming)
MNKWFKTLVVGALSLLAMTSQAADKTTSTTDFQEGVHYTTLPGPSTTKPEVTEYFSYYCPHCYRLEPVVEQMKANLPKGMAFKRSHVDFLRFDSQSNQETLTRADSAAVRLGVEHKMTNALFEAIQIKKKRFSEDADLLPLFMSVGITEDSAKKALSSFSVKRDTKVQLNKQGELLRARALPGVPTLIVNGKYRLNFKHLSKTNFVGDLNALIAHLEQFPVTKG